ncbi:MAG TPA: STAS domain-containing protein [Candidatus Acidoferrales bacterium]|nr:STAS domain-containing protein [Candidatus Acidoferrales bacterium]HVC38784.1 STAS domain-containing protein [Candidatus Dormibacteraeota bacterium]
MNTTFGVAVRAIPGGVVLELEGDIDGTAGPGLVAAYQKAVVDTSPQRVLLDFTAADYINSSGIALIVSVLAQARSEHREVLASGLSDHYREIFEITRLADFIELHSNRDEAVNRIAESSGRPRQQS